MKGLHMTFNVRAHQMPCCCRSMQSGQTWCSHWLGMHKCWCSRRSSWKCAWTRMLPSCRYGSAFIITSFNMGSSKIAQTSSVHSKANQTILSRAFGMYNRAVSTLFMFVKLFQPFDSYGETIAQENHSCPTSIRCKGASAVLRT